MHVAEVMIVGESRSGLANSGNGFGRGDSDQESEGKDGSNSE